jgi:uncharacterized protein (TIGR02145 family)
MKKVTLILCVKFMAAMMLASCTGGGTKDEESPNETTLSNEVTIGEQVWMTKNLNVSTFRNGDPIPHVKTKDEWVKSRDNKQPAWCYYNNDSANGAKYGKLYNWYAVIDPRGLAPVGYHIPSDAEWTVLTDYLGGEVTAGAKMKNKSGWNSYMTGGSETCPNCINWNAEYRGKVPCHTCKDTRSVDVPQKSYSGNGTNTSGFSGLPGGHRLGYSGSFDGIGEYYGFWWSSTEDGTTYAWFCGLVYYDGRVISSVDSKGNGFSVRCLRD